MRSMAFDDNHAIGSFVQSTRKRQDVHYRARRVDSVSAGRLDFPENRNLLSRILGDGDGDPGAEKKVLVGQNFLNRPRARLPVSGR